MKVYFISGLGADRRVFKYIQLPIGFEAVYLDWIEPEKNESLRNYAFRLSEKIDAHEAFAIIGLSMGGMMASEIAIRLKPLITILISSVPNSKGLPFYFKGMRGMNLHKIIPISLVKSGSMAKRFFTTESGEDKTMIRQIIKESDNGFIRWALGAVPEWRNEEYPDPYIHIHGSKDKVLPIRFTKPTHIIHKAGHMMVMTHAKELNRIIAEELNKKLRN